MAAQGRTMPVTMDLTVLASSNIRYTMASIPSLFYLLRRMPAAPPRNEGRGTARKKKKKKKKGRKQGRGQRRWRRRRRTCYLPFRRRAAYAAHARRGGAAATPWTVNYNVCAGTRCISHTTPRWGFWTPNSLLFSINYTTWHALCLATKGEHSRLLLQYLRAYNVTKIA